MKNLEKTIGIILLVPALVSVPLFFLNLFFKDFGGMNNLSPNWTGGAYYTGDSGAGFTSSVPIYFGLMAIAGVYLLKTSKKK